MKRLVLALAILGTGTTVFCTLRNSNVQLGRETTGVGEALRTQTQLIAQARIELTSVEERVRDLKTSARAQSGAVDAGTSSALAWLAGAKHLTAEESKEMLAELGFDWHSTGDYLIVSKDSLRMIRVDGVQGLKLTDTACALLAITPDERSSIEAMTQSLGDRYKAWAEQNIQREEPSGNVVAKYSLPADPDFTGSLSNQFANGIEATLGGERADLLRQYASDWMTDLGMYGTGGNSLTVKRYQSGDESKLSFELRYSGNMMSSDVSPNETFPEAFAPLFPNGWADVASREGFALPSSFKKE